MLSRGKRPNKKMKDKLYKWTNTDDPQPDLTNLTPITYWSGSRGNDGTVSKCLKNVPMTLVC